MSTFKFKFSQKKYTQDFHVASYHGFRKLPSNLKQGDIIFKITLYTLLQGRVCNKWEFCFYSCIVSE